MFDPKSTPPTTSKMLKLFSKLAIPAILTNVGCFISVITNAIFAARMNDPTKLAAFGLSGVVVVIMVQSLLIGLNAA